MNEINIKEMSNDEINLFINSELEKIKNVTIRTGEKDEVAQWIRAIEGHISSKILIDLAISEKLHRENIISKKISENNASSATLAAWVAAIGVIVQAIVGFWNYFNTL